jgi:hypothetical protein
MKNSSSPRKATALKTKKYSTLAAGPAQSHEYHDRDSLPFNASYPLIEFKDEIIDKGAPPESLRKHMLHNYWFQNANSLERDIILDRMVHLNKNIDIVLDFLSRQYETIGFKILHISVAGSYVYAPEPGDIDLDVVLSGSFFDYRTFNEGIELLDLTGSVQKVSVTVMGIDNILGNKFTNDDIRNQGYTHHDTILREMLVAPMRNITVYGLPFDNKKNIDSRNVLVRIARQLYFAELTLEGKIPYYENEPLRTRKAVKRIREAYQIIDWLLNNSNDLKK